MKYLKTELGEPAVGFMRTLKQAIDPQNIMNPGKIVAL
jgi:D-lactate dehydrogenase (cytochrome)